jgi:tRNA(Ile)-lysidine synthase
VINEIQKVVQKTIEEYQLILPGDLVIAGVSGGPDSLTMLHILKELQPVLKFKLHVAHVDHCFRGKEAEAEARWVKETAERWGLPCTVTKVNVPYIAQEKGISAQEAGHLIRKKFFRELLKKLSAQKIALGHQADDQAETVLMHFLVGAGLEGLQGIVPKNGPLIRPLLFLRRQEIEDYCRENFLEPRRDPSNQKDIYLRNKIRLQIIPWLEKESNPNLVETLNRTASILQAEEDFLQKETLKLAKKFIQSKEKKVSLSLKGWGFLHIAMQRRLIRFAYRKVGKKQGLAFFHVEEVRSFMGKGEVGKVLQLPGKINVEKSYEEILFYDRKSSFLNMEGIAKRILRIPGETFIPETGQRIIAEIIEGVCGQSEKGKIYLPWEECVPKFYIRSRKAGDRFSPLGLQGTKKLKDFLIEKKVPRQKRDQLILVVAGEEIVWIPGLALTKKCRMQSKNEKYLVLTLHNSS